jgi:hypothetical protein
MNRTLALLTLLAALAATTPALAQYNKAAGTSVPMVAEEAVSTDHKGRKVTTTVHKKAESDSYGNARGNKYDLAVDGAFEGQTITVIHLYTGGGFDFELPRKALKEKGFSVYRWHNGAPPAKALAAALKKSNQLWIISGDRQHLGPEHLAVIKEFFEAGHGLYLWGDNAPYTGDANYIARALFDVHMDDKVFKTATKVVTLQKKRGEPGFVPNHLITTGLEFLYEGHTIPALYADGKLEPLIYGSDDILVAGIYNKNGRRAIVDTGFTRLYINWDTAGTGRYVKNAAAWLANVERFGDDVTATR